MPKHVSALAAVAVAAALLGSALSGIAAGDSNPLRPRPYGLGTTTRDSLRYYGQRLYSENPDIREAALSGVESMGRRAEELAGTIAQVTTDLDPAVRAHAAQTLTKVALPEIAVPALDALVTDTVQVVRESAYSALAAYGHAARSVLPKLRKSPEAASIGATIAAVGGASTGTAEAKAAADAKFIAEDLKAVSPIMRRLAAKSLGEMRTSAKAAIPALVKALEDGDVTLRRTAAQSLFVVDPVGPGTRAALLARVADSTEVLENRMEIFRHTAASAVELRQPIERRLLGQLSEHDDAHRHAAASLLGAIHDPLPETVTALAAALEDPSQEVRVAAANSLGELGTAAKVALPAMQKALRAGDPRLRSVVEISIARIDQ